MEPWENMKAVQTLLKTLHRGVEQLRMEYRLANSGIEAHIQDLRQRGQRGSTKELRNMQEIQWERHRQLAELVPRMRSARICVMQAKQRVNFGSLEFAAAPLLVSLLELAMSKDPLPEFHLMWDVRIDPLLLMRAELDMLGRTSDRNCENLWRLARKDMHFALKLRGDTLRELRSELLALLNPPVTAEVPSVTADAHEAQPNYRRLAFEALRVRLIDTLSPEEIGLLKEFGRFF